ncbi:MAG TPA: hypothetical protein VGU74_09145 [Gemmatimonadales bacterium]|nr:hypothetical protein [Gemmatimonadales bacterium]
MGDSPRVRGNGPLKTTFDFDTTAPWRLIVKIALAIAAIYVILVVGLFLKGDFLPGLLLLAFAAAFSAVLRRARAVSMGAVGRLTPNSVTVHPVRVCGYRLNVPSGEFPLDRFAAVGVVERVIVGGMWMPQGDSGTVQLLGKAGTPNIDVMSGAIDAARGFAAELSAALKLELRDVAVPGQTIRRYTT